MSCSHKQRNLASLWLNMVHCMQYIHACHQGDIVYVTEKTEKLLLWQNNRQKSASGELGWIKSSLQVKNSSAFLHSSKKNTFLSSYRHFLSAGSRKKNQNWWNTDLKSYKTTESGLHFSQSASSVTTGLCKKIARRISTKKPAVFFIWANKNKFNP